MTYAEALSKHYNQLVGYKIQEVVILEPEDTEEAFGLDSPRVCLILTQGKKKLLVEVLSDEEGNGTGHLDIIEMREE